MTTLERTEVRDQKSEDRHATPALTSPTSDLRPPTSATPPLPRLLLPGEAEQLAACEELIERGLKTFLEVGFALISIRDRRLYRAKFATWDDYCQERWSMSARRATQLCSASETVRELGFDPANRNNCSDLVVPANEAQVRALAGLPPEEQREAWAEALATAPHGRPTAKHIKQVVQRRRQPAGQAQIGTIVPISPADGLFKPQEANGAHQAEIADSNPRDSFRSFIANGGVKKHVEAKETTEERVVKQLDRAIVEVRAALDEIGTPRSEHDAAMLGALETLEKCRVEHSKPKPSQASRS